MKKILFIILLSSISTYSQNISNSQELDSISSIQNLDEVTVDALRAKNDTPVPFKNIAKADLVKINLAQDIPTLIKNTPSVLMHSDGGTGIGYSAIHIRGSDETRVNVTINGVPYNDSESMNVYWVDLPDFSSSVESIQIQRGVGTSTNGAGAFGGSVNIQTSAASEEPMFEITNTLGSFNTIKNSVGFSTGFINENFELSGRLSRIKSDGYIDRSGSNLRSYFLQGVYQDENTLIKLLNFAGHEVTDQAWYGVDGETLNSNRTYNPAGEYYHEDGDVEYYENQDDNYKQDNYQLQWNQILDNGWTSNIGLHYTHGRGYYENYNVAHEDHDEDHEDDEEHEEVDTIDRRWLDNKFNGMIFSFSKETEKFDAVIGGAYNVYNGKHFGEYLWKGKVHEEDHEEDHEEHGFEYNDRFYDDKGDKKEFNIYAKIDYHLTDQLSIYGDLQYRSIAYDATFSPYSGGGDGHNHGNVGDEVFTEIDKKYDFFNPKFGLFYNLNSNYDFYLSYARAQKEPTRSDFANGNPYPEKLDDFELGWKGKFSNFLINANAFYMLYDNQLVLTGQRDNLGNQLRNNVGESYRLGLEIDTKLFINPKWNLETNFTISENKNIDFYYNFDGQLRGFGDTDLAYSPSIIANNILNFNPNQNFLISLRSNYIGEQYFAQINSPISKLDSFFINDLNIVYDMSIPGFSDNMKLKVLVNNIFDVKYSNHGGYYTYDVMENGRANTYEGTYYYPQAGTNILLALDIKF
jgi:iron complex outermembrane receptor protein